MSKKHAVVLVMAALFVIMLSHGLFAQDSPEYSFVSFERSYDEILRSGRGEQYVGKEEEVGSQYGKHLVTLEKTHKFYTERLFLFFSDQRELIFYTVEFELDENHSKRIIDKLVSSIVEKLIAEYGESESETVPYYRIAEDKDKLQYEIFVKPNFAASTKAVVSFKHLSGYDEYQTFYGVEIVSEEEEEIRKTVENF